MTRQELRKRLNFWKKQLNLQDWRFKLKCVPQQELASRSNHAEVVPHADHGAAQLWICPDDQYVEFFLVHELGHVVLAGLSKEESYDLLEERAINRYTYALCRAHGIPCPPIGAT